MAADTLHWSNADVEVHKVVVGPVDNNVFVVRCTTTVGFELVSRIYRLLEKGDDENHHLNRLSKMLSDDALLDELFAANKITKRTRAEFGASRDEMAAMLSSLQDSIEYQRI
jgi:hypothetical protein